MAEKTVFKLKELASQENVLASGHGLCAGCSESVIANQVMHAIGKPAVVACATGCLEVSTSRYPYTSWRASWIHSAFENAASTISGVEAAYKAMVRKGRLESRDLAFVVFAGDGATYDIGLQWLSGAVERGHRFLYVCLNNEGYMNTGIQASGATIAGTWTTTTPVGSVRPGKVEWRKDMTAMMVDNGVLYAAQAAPHHWKDLMSKVKKAVEMDGPTFINILAPCNRGWRYQAEDTIAMSRLAVETCVWPLFEVENGKWTINNKPDKKPVRDWLESQGRFSHLLKPENASVVEQIQSRVDKEWDTLLKRAEQS